VAGLVDPPYFAKAAEHSHHELVSYFLSKNRGAKPPGNENNITTNKSTEGLTSKHERKA
jgi:hypothetical protein